jgi:hypothetical protein
MDLMYPTRVGVPVPPRSYNHKQYDTDNHNARSRYDWSQRQVGDSFVVPFNGIHPAHLSRKISCAAVHAQEKYGFRFVTRMLPEGIGVWRVA